MMRTGAAREFGLVAALLTLWTLSVHAVLPGMGHVPAAPGDVICTLQGAQAQSPDRGAPVHAPVECCTHCLATIVPPPDGPRLAVGRLQWTAMPRAAVAAVTTAGARVLPRPHGQGPPLT